MISEPVQSAEPVRSAWHVALAVVAASVLGAALPACDTVKAPGYGRQDPLPKDQYPQIAALGGLQQWIGFDTPVVERTPVLAVSVPARALTDGQDLNVQYRYFWLDSSGRPAQADPAWSYKKMPSRSQIFFEGNALDSKYENFRLEVRPAR